MKLYLSGPMAGLPEHNVPLFRATTAQLRAKGYDVIDPSENFGGDLTRSRAEYMRVDIAHVLEVDALALLPGWWSSAGAKCEIACAEQLDLPILDAIGMAEDVGARFAHVEGPLGTAVKAVLVEAYGMRRGDPRFHALLAEIAALHDRKQADYGTTGDPLANIRQSEQWGIPSWVGAMVRLNDKIKRLQAFAQKGQLANESAEDSMLDISVYALLALILYREQREPAAA